MMNKIYLFCFAVLTVLATSCSKDDETLDPAKGDATAKICFDSNVTQTRADGNNVLKLLNNQFTVIGQKTIGETVTTVFDETPVTYDSGWSYGNPVSWDFDATNYDFVAYSKGKGNASVSDEATINGFTVNGSKDDLLKFCFTNKTTVDNSQFGKTVNLTFSQLAAKLRLEFYESINGFDVKDLTFKIYAENEVFPTESSYTVTYDENNKVVLNSETEDSKKSKDLTEASLSTISSSVNSVTSPDDDCLVLPMSAPSTKLKIEVTYTLVATGLESETQVTKKAVLANSFEWQYQHRYIYRLEITNTGLECVQFKDDEWDNDYRH